MIGIRRVSKSLIPEIPCLLGQKLKSCSQRPKNLLIYAKTFLWDVFSLNFLEIYLEFINFSFRIE